MASHTFIVTRFQRKTFWQLMKVVRAEVGCCYVDGPDAVCFYVDYAALDLEQAFDVEESSAGYEDALALKQVRSNDDISDAGFVFQRQEDKPLGRAWTLTRNYGARYSHKTVGTGSLKFIGGYVSFASEGIAVIFHRMRSAGEAGARIVGGKALIDRHFSQGHVVAYGWIACPISKQWTDGSASLLNLP
jgi:hypothetical protein